MKDETKEALKGALKLSEGFRMADILQNSGESYSKDAFSAFVAPYGLEGRGKLPGGVMTLVDLDNTVWAFDFHLNANSVLKPLLSRKMEKTLIAGADEFCIVTGERLKSKALKICDELGVWPIDRNVLFAIGEHRTDPDLVFRLVCTDAVKAALSGDISLVGAADIAKDFLGGNIRLDDAQNVVKGLGDLFGKMGN